MLPLPAADATPLLVVAKRDVTKSATELDLQPLGEKWTYLPGQYLTVYIREQDGQLRPRWFSLASYPENGEPLQIVIKHNPGGFGSGWLRENTAVGAILLGSKPRGTFTHQGFSRTAAFLGAGSGIVPLVALASAAIRESSQHVRMMRCSVSQEETLCRRTMDALVDRAVGRIELVDRYDDTSGGMPKPEDIINWLGAKTDCDLYLCGPGAFMAMAEQAALQAGVPAAQVIRERHNQSASTP